MNREILFRGKRLDNNEWAEGHFYTQVYYPETIEEDWYGFIKPFGSRSWEYVQVDHNTVGQYTGLKDKNGQRIFEGDILAGAWNTKLVIYFDEDYLQFRAREVSLYARENSIDYYNNGELEVIGNIYDNPELIGGAHD